MTTKLLDRIELHATKEARYAVIWLHGLGANGHDFAPMMAQLNDHIRSYTYFVLPHSPLRPVTINNGLVMPAWYDLLSFDIVSRADLKTLEEARQQIDALIQSIELQGIPAGRIFLGGFSQGCATALYSGLRYPKPLAGIIGFSGYLPLATELAQIDSVQKATPIYLAHGQFDNVVAYTSGHDAYTALQRTGYLVQWHAYSSLHTVMPEQAADFERWLNAQIVVE